MDDIRFMYDCGAQEQGIYKTLADAVKAAQQAVEVTKGVVFWSPVHRSSDGQQTRAVVALRVPGEGIYTFDDSHEVLVWWRNLPAGVRDALAAEPGKALTADELVTATNTRPRAVRAISVAWVDTEDLEKGRYRLVTELQHFVRAMCS